MYEERKMGIWDSELMMLRYYKIQVHNMTNNQKRGSPDPPTYKLIPCYDDGLFIS